ncbi:hypothetical protein M3194_13615 [Paenibacillus glycanilyticus]|uniref:hypothetical protein n=1 Tax=Paenibacillus glycanilyticus TaxID=126569 RepID=UPI00203B0168|nr:hypothetical protein [Paenibacillus glycanilyticus]MCM3628402.1 hypothetical protein [Paenibacillus glycanilyticus]
MKKGWFELDKYKPDVCYCFDDCKCSEAWAIHIYSYEAEDVSAPDVALILNKTDENNNGYVLTEFSISFVGRAVMFEEATALVKRLDEISRKKASVCLTEHLVICREFFDCGKVLHQTAQF